MTPTPPDSALLAAGIAYLEGQLLPALEGEHRFKTRLLVNALKIVARNQTAARASLASDDDEAASQLALAIRNKRVALDDPALLAQLDALLRRNLQINNPKWLDGPPVATQNASGAKAAVDSSNN
jgi:Domain of unknown function (DUF6285)